MSREILSLADSMATRTHLNGVEIVSTEDPLTVTDNRNPERLADYIRSLPGFSIYTQIDGTYNHVGATLADAVLQRHSNYEHSVRPRITHILKVYANDTSLRDLKQLLQQLTANEFLQWNGVQKPRTFLDLVGLLDKEGVNTEEDLRKWILRGASNAKLRDIRFVGPKTVDYLKILVGLPTAAPDLHLLKFLELAGLGKLDYMHAQEVIHRTADLMHLGRAHLDHSIWLYMSGSKATTSGRGAHCTGS